MLRILFRMKRLKKVQYQNEEAVAVEEEGEAVPIVLKVVSDPKRLVGQKPLITAVHAAKRVSHEENPADLGDRQRRMRLTSLSMRKSRSAKLRQMRHRQLVVRREVDVVDVVVEDGKMQRLILPQLTRIVASLI